MVSYARAMTISFLLLILIVKVGFLNTPATSAMLPFENGRIKVDVYVVALDGVETMEVTNLTRVIEGAQKAVESLNMNNLDIALPFGRKWENVSSHFYQRGEHSISGFWYVHTRFPANASLSVITQWNEYKNIVESSVESVVVNAHGAVIPIPDGYTKEGWIDKIAEAMLYRNLTWVHLGGYPFYYYQMQDSNMETWGENGLQQLMTHIGKPNTKCYFPKTFEHDGMPPDCDIMSRTWWMTQAYIVRRLWPLNYTEFKDLVAMPLWPSTDSAPYLVGGAIAFKEDNNQTSFGFYIHIGTNKTYSGSMENTDSDHSRSYVSVATGLYCLVSRTARETILSEAENLINKAQAEDRTKGLDKARSLLAEAEFFDTQYGPMEFWDRIYESMIATVNAEKPPPPSTDQNIAIMALIVASVTLTGIFWRRRNNKKEERET